MKLKRVHVILLNLLAFSIMLITTIVIGSNEFSSDIFIPETSSRYAIKEWGNLHIILMTSFVIMTIFLGIVLIQELIAYSYDDDSWLFRNDNYEDKTMDIKNNFLKRKYFYYVLSIFILWFLYNMINPLYTQSIKIYNKSKIYQNSYTQKVQEKEGFYDKLWKTYLTKEKITNVNKETFLQVSRIIMENRKDGQDITWKWVQENQQIPYEEFTKFYADLSNFITSQREGYFNIEKECQVIANNNNTLLDTFPNNILNRFLECKRIKFEYGLLSDSTSNVFKTKKENLQ